MMSPDFDARSPEVEALIANDGPSGRSRPSVTGTQMLRLVFISNRLHEEVMPLQGDACGGHSLSLAPVRRAK